MNHPSFYTPLLSRDLLIVEGTNIVSSIDPTSYKGYIYFILVAIYYFSKLAKLIPLREVKVHNVLSIFNNHIVYQFSVPHQIIYTNSLTFRAIKIHNFNRHYDIE